jgi:hypothetical protein
MTFTRAVYDERRGARGAGAEHDERGERRAERAESATAPSHGEGAVIG